MSDFKFDPSDVGADTSTGTEDSDTSAPSMGNVGSGLFMLPLSIIAVYALVAKGAVLAALEGIIGAGALALAITHAFWIGGVVVGGAIAVLAIFTVVNLLGAIVKQSGANAAFAGLGLAYFAAGAAGAKFLFSGVPFLVGFVLTTNLLIYVGILLVALGLALSVSVLV